MTLDGGKLAQGAAGVVVAAMTAFVWDAHADLARVLVRLDEVEEVVVEVVDTIDALHPRGSAARGGGEENEPPSKMDAARERLLQLRQRAEVPAPEPTPEPTPQPVPEAPSDDDSGDDDDSGVSP